MGTIDVDIQELQRRLSDGSIQRAYKGIVSFMSHLRTVFSSQQGTHAVSGLYQGHLDMTYFALYPDELKKRDLKIAIVFNYLDFRFEVWLAARNRPLQRRYWQLFVDAGYKKHPLAKPAVGTDAIVEAVLVTDCSFKAANDLTDQIVKGVKAFEGDMIAFLDKVDAI
ncbi:hypothetical protein JXO59_00510 [candidate division KSB1 bacterium]|nr:hypothetical protein [candidate division KSB1 bacterium]